MEQIIFRPSLFKFETCKEFSEAFDLKKGGSDINKPIYL